MLSALFAHVKQGFTFVPTLNLFSKRLKEPCFLVLFKAYKINWLYVKQVWPAGAQDRVPGPILAHAGIQFWKNTTDDLRKYLLFSPPPHIPSIPIRVSDSHAPLWAICLSLSTIKYYIKKKKIRAWILHRKSTSLEMVHFVLSKRSLSEFWSMRKNTI